MGCPIGTMSPQMAPSSSHGDNLIIKWCQGFLSSSLGTTINACQLAKQKTKQKNGGRVFSSPLLFKPLGQYKSSYTCHLAIKKTLEKTNKKATTINTGNKYTNDSILYFEYEETVNEDTVAFTVICTMIRQNTESCQSSLFLISWHIFNFFDICLLNKLQYVQIVYKTSAMFCMKGWIAWDLYEQI